MSRLSEPRQGAGVVMHGNTRRRSSRWAGSSSSWVGGIAHRLTQHTTFVQREACAPTHHSRRILLTALLALMGLLVVLATPALAKSTHEYTGVSFGPNGSGLGFFGDPQGVAVDSAGDVYVYDNSGAGSVYKFNAAGEPEDFSVSKTNVIEGVGHASFPAVDELAVSPAGATKGDLYVANDGNVGIYSSQTGEKLGELNSGVTTFGGPWGPACGVTVDTKGDVYVGLETGGHVNRYAPSGAVAENKDYTSSLNGLPGESCNLAVDSEENVYVTTWEHGPVTRYAPIEFGALKATGTVVDNKGSTIAVDPAGKDLYVDEQNQIAEYDLTAEPPSLLDTSGASGPGALSGSFGVAVDSASGDVYVVENHRVEIFGPLITVIEHTLSVTTEGTTGTVTSSPAGIDCGTTCSAEFVQNSTVTLTATPIGDSKFTGWSGPDAGSCSTAPTCEVQIGTSDRAVTATFAFAAPKWGLTLEHHNAYGTQGGVDPFTGSGTTFDRESGANEYTITATNTGEAQTSGPVSVVDQLPEGIVLAGSEREPEVSGEGWSCAIVNGAVTVTCTRSDNLAAGEAYPPIVLHVHVQSGAANLSTNVASVSGGGAATATVNDPTTIATVPFGVQSFTTSVTEELGNPFTQAGGHPFAASAAFTLDYVPDDKGELRTVGGSPKDIETELPPGFVGSPQDEPKCPVSTFETGASLQEPCPIDTAVGFIHFSYAQGRIEGGHAVPLPGFAPTDAVYNLTTSGSPAAFGFIGSLSGAHFTLTARVRSDGDYGITVSSPYTAKPTPLAVELTFCENGVTASGPPPPSRTYSCSPAVASGRPFLTNPTQCSSTAPVTTLSANSYQDPADYASITSYTGAPSAATAFAGAATSQASPVLSSFLTGCDLLQFNPKFVFEPETSQAGQPTGMNVDLNVPQTNEASVSATPELKDATVTLPEGMSVDPSAADGLQACTDAQFGLGSKTEPAEPAACPVASQVATARIVSPLLEKPLAGEVFLGQPQCSPCTAQDAHEGRVFRLFLQAQGSGVIVKVAGRVMADPVTGRLTAVFEDQPQLPFSVLELSFTGGPRAPLANPQTCGTAMVGWDMTPWSAPGTGGLSGTERVPGTPDGIAQEPSFNVDWDGHGGACPGSLPFSPSFLAQSASPTAGAYSNLAVMFGRPQPAHEAEERDEQNLAGITLVTPPGLLGKIAGVPLCEEPQAGAGTCAAASQIGTVTAGAGPGSHPFYVNGKVYLTGPYKGAPFGLSIVVPAVAGPFNLGTVVVRASINVNPNDAHLTITSDPFPQIVDGVPLRLHRINVEVNRPEFTFNPTNCTQQQITATLTGEHINPGEASKSSVLASEFAAANCSALAFAPSFTASTQGKTSKANGASLTVKVAYPQGSEANIKYVKVDLPKQLPSRLTTLQKACVDSVFEANPANCPAGSVLGTATAVSPVLSVPLSGPAYFVSHGGAAFPDLEVVLQGEGVTVILDGSTFISKQSITSTTFGSVPDAPISSFQITLPEGPHSALAANWDLCASKLVMPTSIIAQNGKQIIQQTKIAVTGCTKTKTLTRAQKLAKALRACRKKRKKKRAACEHQARKKYGAKAASKKAKKTNRRGH